MQVCVVCHNANATDIARRPENPAEAPDGKREESIDMKRMIHRIHMGAELEEGIVVYGFGNRVHDYSEVEFIGNTRNCLTCHVPGSYGADDAWVATPTTIDSGVDPTDPSDDLNLSPVTSVCSSCHDSEMAEEHMILNGGTFASLDVHIAVGEAPVPEPGRFPLALAAMITLVAIARRRSQHQNQSSSRFREWDPH
jgi:OmcA/MtrC family decaheme c-type cytochrome